jgi:hypothetical protein
MRWTTTGNWKYEECNDYKHWWYTWYTSAGGRREEKRNLRPFTKDMKEDGRLQHFGVFLYDFEPYIGGLALQKAMFLCNMTRRSANAIGGLPT